MKPRYEPTEKDRRIVEAMTAGGITQEDVGRAIGASPKTLRKHFRDILDSSELRANAQVIATLFRMATSGKDVAATIFWCKTRLKWRDASKIEVGAPDGKEGGGITVIVRSVLQPAGVEEEERRGGAGSKRLSPG